jgi:hypothetical protein
MTLTPSQLRIARAMPEAELQEEVRAMCRSLGLIIQHVENSLQGRVWVRGWPDLEIIGEAILYRELKRQDQDPTADQRLIGRAIRRGGGDWDVWRPSDLLDGTIARQLTAISRLRIAAYVTAP